MSSCLHCKRSLTDGKSNNLNIAGFHLIYFQPTYRILELLEANKLRQFAVRLGEIFFSRDYYYHQETEVFRDTIRSGNL